MEASFTAIARGITHADLNAETMLIMAPDPTSKLWRKIFLAHEEGTLLNPDKPGRTYLDDYHEAQQKLKARHEKKKSPSAFEEKPYVCKPLTRETFKGMGGLTRADFFLCAKRILEVRDGEEVPRVTFRNTKNLKVRTLKTWCNYRKWKNILLQELSARDPNELGIWSKDEDGYDCVDRDVWCKFKNEHGITRAKWEKLYQAATEAWLNKKRAPNHKFLEVPTNLDKMLHEWLDADIQECNSQVITRWVNFNSLKKQLVIPHQDRRDVEWLSKSTISAGIIDFRFIPGCVDAPVSTTVVESLVKSISDPLWYPGLKTVPAWMIVSDVRNHPAAQEFICTLIRRHPDTFLNIPSFYFPCNAEDLPPYKEVESRRSSPALYVDFLTCTKICPRQKLFPCPMLAPDAPRYKVNPKLWSELNYEVSRGELRMETYLTFLHNMGLSGAVVINFFGGLKPIAASLVSYSGHVVCLVLWFELISIYHVFLTFACVQMHDFNVFSYMDSAFMHTLDDKIAHIRRLRISDFAEDDNREFEVEREHPLESEPEASPLRQLVCVPSHTIWSLSCAKQRIPWLSLL